MVSRVWRAFGLQPHKADTFKLSTDPAFVDKVWDIVGLYLAPPLRAVVLCFDEKPQIQALTGTAPVLPMRPGQPERRTHDYRRHGTTDLFAALDIQAGTVIDRSGTHAETWLGDFHGIVQADAFSGFLRLYKPGRKPGPIREAACWAHAKRKFFELADLRKAPIAIEAVTRIDAIFAIERAANGLEPDERRTHHQARSAALVADLEAWLRENRAKLSTKAPTAAAIDYMLKRWSAFNRYLDDGHACFSNNAAERAIRPIAVGLRN